MFKAGLLICTVVLGGSLAVLPAVSQAAAAHTVSQGDTLWAISQQYGTTVESIMVANDMNSTVIHPGQTLLVEKGVANSRTTTQSVKPATVSRSGDRIQEIIDYAKSLTGSPYSGGGNTPSGFDCSGYTKYVFANFGVNIPRTAAEQYRAGQAISSSEAKPGDLVVFSSGGYISHVGIYLGNSQFISSTSSRGVIATSIYGPYWGEHFYGFSRIIPQ